MSTQLTTPTAFDRMLSHSPVAIRLQQPAEVAAFTRLERLLPSFDRRQEMRTMPRFKELNQLWNGKKFNRRNVIGPVVHFARGFVLSHRGADRSEFGFYFLGRHMSPVRVLKEVDRFRELANVTPDQAMGWWWLRVIDDTWAGVQNEFQLMDTLLDWTRERGEFIRFSSLEESKLFGIDAVIMNSEKQIINGVQFKRASYFEGVISRASWAAGSGRTRGAHSIHQAQFKAFKTAKGVDVLFCLEEETFNNLKPIFMKAEGWTANRYYDTVDLWERYDGVDVVDITEPLYSAPNLLN